LSGREEIVTKAHNRVMEEVTKVKNAANHFLSRRRLLQGATLATAGAMFGRRAFAAPSQALKFVGWQYEPEIVANNVKIFEKLYDEKVNYELVTGNYPTVAETRLTGGQQYDMLYSEEDTIARWHAAGWIRDLEGLPGVDEVKKSLYRVSLQSMSLPDGKLCGMPYYAGYNSFLYDEEALSKAKVDVPETWDDVLEACRKLKKDKISDTPYHASWQLQWPDMSWDIFAAWYSEGAKVFDDQGNFVDEPALRKILTTYQTLFKEKLVTPDIMTLPGEGVPEYATGNHVFMVVHDYNQKVANDPKVSKLAGKVKNALMPGKTHSTFAWTSTYQMGAHTISPSRAWNMLQFFGGKAKDGQYHVIKRWALEFGLGSAYPEVMHDPDIVKSFSKWKDLDVAEKQLETATARKIDKTLWFPEWDMFMMGQVQTYIRSDQPVEKIVEALAKNAADLKKQYE
jgi:multiple sugar transport system substrate-binding protein